LDENEQLRSELKSAAKLVVSERLLRHKLRELLKLAAGLDDPFPKLRQAIELSGDDSMEDLLLEKPVQRIMDKSHFDGHPIVLKYPRNSAYAANSFKDLKRFCVLNGLRVPKMRPRRLVSREPEVTMPLISPSTLPPPSRLSSREGRFFDGLEVSNFL
jgi:hypothetical protein